MSFKGIRFFIQAQIRKRNPCYTLFKISGRDSFRLKTQDLAVIGRRFLYLAPRALNLPPAARKGYVAAASEQSGPFRVKEGNTYTKMNIYMADSKAKITAFSELINGDTPVLVDFYTDWCGPCKLMDPTLKTLKKMMGNSIHIIKVDAEKNADATIKYQVRGVPTLILFKSGRILWQQSGVVQLPRLESIIYEKLEE